MLENVKELYNRVFSIVSIQKKMLKMKEYKGIKNPSEV